MTENGDDLNYEKEFLFSNQEIKELLQANLAKNEEILQLTRQVRRYTRMQANWNLIRMIVIVVPIILGFIYLPPLVREFLNDHSLLRPLSFIKNINIK